jgi:hypothetical protein
VRLIYELLSLWGDVRAMRRGPAAYGRRLVRKAAHRQLARVMRRTV